MSKWINEIKQAIITDGFSILKIEKCKHTKITVEKDGVQFFIFVSNTPSDKCRGKRRVIQSLHETHREQKEKLTNKVKTNII